MTPSLSPATSERRWVLVAGGSGGLGGAICRTLASDGWNVAVGYRSGEDAAKRVVNDLINAGAHAKVTHLDLTDASSARMALEATAAEGALSGVVYAAGPHIPMKYVINQDPSTFSSVIDADLKGCYNLLHPSLAYLRETGGSILAVVTPAIDRYAKKDILSSIPKAGIQAAIRGIASEEGRYGIRANCVAVGVIEGDGMWTELIERGDYTEELLAAAKRNTALRRFGDPSDVGEAAAFLMSERAGWVTGQTLRVDGGYTV